MGGYLESVARRGHGLFPAPTPNASGQHACVPAQPWKQLFMPRLSVMDSARRLLSP